MSSEQKVCIVNNVRKDELHSRAIRKLKIVNDEKCKARKGTFVLSCTLGFVVPCMLYIFPLVKCKKKECQKIQKFKKNVENRHEAGRILRGLLHSSLEFDKT